MFQGKALNEVASKNCKVMVVGNPCNTNALIAMENAPSIPRKNFHALTRLDENRAKCQLALKSGKFYTNISRVAIWGNHSTTQVPDFINARIGGRPAIDVIQVRHSGGCGGGGGGREGVQQLMTFALTVCGGGGGGGGGGGRGRAATFDPICIYKDRFRLMNVVLCYRNAQQNGVVMIYLCSKMLSALHCTLNCVDQ